MQKHRTYVSSVCQRCGATFTLRSDAQKRQRYCSVSCASLCKPRKITAIPDRFWPKVDKHGPLPEGHTDLGPCWLWTASIHDGYGQFKGVREILRADHVAWELTTGAPIGPDSTLRHRCGVRRCVCPDHCAVVPKQPVRPARRSAEERQVILAEHLRRKSRPNICQQCGAEYLYKSTNRVYQRFCSHPCFTTSVRQKYESTVAERFWAFVRKTDGCWIWEGKMGRRDYGTFAIEGVQRGAHRVAWILTRGAVPDGLVVCHACDNPPPA